MLFVVHAVDKTDMLPTRAKFYRAHRVHLDDAVNYDVDVVTAAHSLLMTARLPWAAYL